jgi:hypothetical protein
MIWGCKVSGLRVRGVAPYFLRGLKGEGCPLFLRLGAQIWAGFPCALSEDYKRGREYLALDGGGNAWFGDTSIGPKKCAEPDVMRDF